MISGGNTESGRVSNILSESRRCMAAEALAKARALRGGKACGALCSFSPPKQVQLPSMVLSATVKKCYSGYKSFEGCVPESVYIARVQQKTIDLSTAPTNIEQRFSQYARLFPAPCPAPPPWYAHAGEPILQGKNCALPNKPDNPVLPG